MLTKVCPHCSKTYRIEDVRVDENWNKWSFDAAYCHCPYCDSILPSVYPDTVDLARHLKPKYILVFVALFAAFGLGVITNTLEYIGSILCIVFGIWLAKTAQLKDHRVIGWFLIGLSVIVFLAVNYAA
jgi:hypothetical protein